MMREPKTDFRKMYDETFGVGTFKNLLDSRRKYSSDEYIRINLSKTKKYEIENFLKNNRAEFSQTFIYNCLKIEKTFFKINSSVNALSGKIYSQDLTSLVPVNCIDFESLKRKDRKINILDSCASPGSKTTQLADLLNYHEIEYEIIALEPQIKRHRSLINNVQKQGFRNVKVIESKAEDFKTNIRFDIILADVPCSGNLISDEDWLKKRDLNGILKMAKIQRNIVSNISGMLNKDGILIYSTCSIEVCENEENVEYFKENFSLIDFRPKLKFPFPTQPVIKSQKSIRFMPYKSHTQGFFVCCLKGGNNCISKI